MLQIYKSGFLQPHDRRNIAMADVETRNMQNNSFFSHCILAYLDCVALDYVASVVASRFQDYTI